MDRCSGSHDEVEPFNDSSADVDFKVVSPYKLWPKECRDECVYLDLQGTNHTAQGVHAAPRRASRRERSEERRVGQDCGSTGRSRGSPDTATKNTEKRKN